MCDGRTDGRTDILQQHSLCYAYHDAVKTEIVTNEGNVQYSYPYWAV